MEFELIEHLPGHERDDHDGRETTHDLPALTNRGIARPLDSPPEDQAVCIPEQEDG